MWLDMDQRQCGALDVSGCHRVQTSLHLCSWEPVVVWGGAAGGVGPHWEWGHTGSGRGWERGPRGWCMGPEVEQRHHGVLGGGTPSPPPPLFIMGNLLVIYNKDNT